MIHNLKWNVIGIIVTSFLVASTALSILQMYTLTDGSMPFYSVINVTLDVVGMCVCIILLLTTVFDHHSNMATMYFMAMILFEGFILVWDFQFWFVNGDPDSILQNKLVNYYLLGFILLLLAAFWLYMSEMIKRKDRRFRVIQAVYFVVVAFGLLVILTNPWTESIFIVDDAGVYHRQDYFALTFATPLLLLLIAMVTALMYVDDRKKKLTLCSYTVLPLLGALLQSAFFGIGLIYIALLFSIMLIYGNFYVERGRDLAEKQAEIVEQDVTILTAQIQPYFLYRSLKAISEIENTPPETVKALTEFNRYLRGNMNSFSQKKPITFREEMRHVNTYVNLEKLRFKDKLNVKYELHDSEFDIPALTLQMLVENAIKHGVTIKETGGSITVRTYRSTNAHTIIVLDDGVGFDTTKPVQDDGRSHVGLANVKQRVEEMVGGTLAVESEIGKGTKITITIPFNRQDVRA